MKDKIIAVIVAAALSIFVTAGSLALICLIYAAVCRICGLTFSPPTAAGVYIVLEIIRRTWRLADDS